MSGAGRFDQDRKDAAASVEGQVAACLRDYYNVPPKRCVSTEHGREGEYDTGGDYRPTDLLDYAGVDWLVDAQPAIVPVGERVRPTMRGAAISHSGSIMASRAPVSLPESPPASTAGSPPGRSCSAGARAASSTAPGSLTSPRYSTASTRAS
jgi:hypothetical protein